MNKLTITRGLLIALALTALPYASAQNGLPTAQPKRLTIIREQVKVGRGAAHAKNEAGWPAAYEKAKSPDYYIAMTSLTGTSEAWYLVPFESFAAEGASMKRDDKDPLLSAELARLALADAEYITGSTTVHTMGRPDLSEGKFPTVAKVRFYEISIFSIRSGKDEAFETIAKAYAAVHKRVGAEIGYRVYAVTAGMPDSTYFIVSSVEDYADLDKLAAQYDKIFASTTADEKTIFAKWGEVVAKSETNRFRVDPVQSYVSKEIRASDPEFWSAK